MIFKSLKTCKKHASESELKSLLCDYIDPKTQHACFSYHTSTSNQCFKHNVNRVCNETNCDIPSKGDYCFHHALKYGAKFKLRNRNNNKYFCLNQRDWDILQNRIGCLMDGIRGTFIDKPSGEMTFIYKNGSLYIQFTPQKNVMSFDNRKIL